MQKEMRAIVRGRVQLVMYRDFCTRKARRLGLRGAVRNLSDGTVEVLAQGEPAALEAFIQKLHRGPLLARVDRVEVEWREPASELNTFKILYA
jgi:acylphosphatase